MTSKNAVITGASKGIGKAIAEKFLKEGFNIAICARNQSELDECKVGWERAFPNQKIFAIRADFEIQNEVRAFAEMVFSYFKKIDVLVNNAGIFLGGTVMEEDFSQLKRQIDINLYSAYILSQTIGHKMKEDSEGHIINIASMAGLEAYAGGSSYSISKYAMLGMSDNFRMALKPFGVKVTAICPGPTMSSSWEGSGVPENKLMPADDIANLVWQCSLMSANTCVDRLIVDTTKGL